MSKIQEFVFCKICDNIFLYRLGMLAHILVLYCTLIPMQVIYCTLIPMQVLHINSYASNVLHINSYASTAH